MKGFGVIVRMSLEGIMGYQSLPFPLFTPWLTVGGLLYQALLLTPHH